ncbi:unnamed protein product [Orchesella dallaii]|uniref:Gustatory receptor n=1 Tax=Orchesella dallaii TaxID=48710 RepID=A0ABP1QDA0_9HEXA
MQGLCSILHFIGLLEGFSWIYTSVGSSDTSHPISATIQSFCYICGFSVLLSSIHTAWLRSKELSDFINLYGVSIYKTKNPKLRFRMQNVLLSLAPAILIVVYNMVRIDSWGFQQICSFFSLNETSFKQTWNFQAIRIFFITCKLLCQIMYVFSNGLIIFIVSILKMVGNQYRQIVEDQLQSKEMDINLIIQAEDNVRKAVNSAMQLITMRVILDYSVSITYFATISYLQDGARETLYVGLYLIVSAIFWIIACELHYQVKETTKRWTHPCLRHTTNLSLERKLSVIALQSENEANPVAISCRFFTITYGFLGSMVGLIITYATIVFQMRTETDQIHRKSL